MASGPYRLRLGDGERLFERADAIVLLIEAGEVDGSTPVRAPGSTRWAPLRSLPELAAHLPPDPWAAWEDADEDSMKEALADLRAGTGETLPEADDLDDEATDPGRVPAPVPRREEAALELSPSDIRPLDEPRRSRSDAAGVLELPAHAMSPIDDADVAAVGRPGGLSRRGQVIAFPGGGPGPRVAGSVALDPYAEPPSKPGGGGYSVPTLQPPPPQEPAHVGPQWWRVALVAGLGLGVLTAVQLYVGSTASAVFSAPVAPGGPGAGPSPSPPQPVAAAPAPVDAAAEMAAEEAAEEALGGADAPSQGADAYADIENEIRGQWLERPREINGAGGLEEALLVELPRVHVRVLKVRAPVTHWGGHKNQEPQSADFLIRYSARPGELDRELAAIALVVGRYMSIYRLESERLTVELQGSDGDLRRIRLPPKEALRLYEQRVSLVDFLTQLAGG